VNHREPFLLKANAGQPLEQRERRRLGELHVERKAVRLRRERGRKSSSKGSDTVTTDPSTAWTNVMTVATQ
jgi:hypothetical protein